MAEGPRAAPARTARSGRDLFMLGIMDRINDQFRLLDTMILGACSDSWDYLPPRAKHILWLKLASGDLRFLEEVGLPVENGVLMHWSMWPADLGDYAQAIALKMTRDTMSNLEPRNVAMQAAMDQARIAERTAGMQIQLADRLVQLVAMGADPQSISVLFSKNKHDREAVSRVIQRAEETMMRAMEREEEAKRYSETQTRAEMREEMMAVEAEEKQDLESIQDDNFVMTNHGGEPTANDLSIEEIVEMQMIEQESHEMLTEEEILSMEQEEEEFEEQEGENDD